MPRAASRAAVMRGRTLSDPRRRYGRDGAAPRRLHPDVTVRTAAAPGHAPQTPSAGFSVSLPQNVATPPPLSPRAVPPKTPPPPPPPKRPPHSWILPTRSPPPL